MFIMPFDLSVSLWLTAVPEFETVIEPLIDPVATADPMGPAPQDTDDVCAGGNHVAPRSREVFKGMRWIGCPVWSMRENPAWQQMSQRHREEDEQRLQERSRDALRPPAVQPRIGVAPSWEAPQCPETMPSAKLDAKGTST